MVLFYSFYFLFFCFLISILPIILVRGTNGAPQGTPLGKRDGRCEDALFCLKDSGAKGYSDACLYLLFRVPHLLHHLSLVQFLLVPFALKA
ncbi:hypothetical protein BDV39DRAFT_67949 [Aspergillus sergii]|uniref:Uncharacterized protein n=1 Tax=Aspergillus sergii TaxID=1034303 RepID=A0A5N6X6S2_9EURO|nr:hypothetical protein BDV39DRAFT_67949 [Aspergillus sergii]